MTQTENTAIVLRHVDYKDNDRMITLLSPTRGRLDAIIRNCRKPRSPNLNASELFTLGDYMLFEKDSRITVDSVNIIEAFYPLRTNYERLTCGMYLLNLCEAAAEPEQEQKDLFMLLLHTLSRLTYFEQEWQPLLSGFLLHFSVCTGTLPQLNTCVRCGKMLDEHGPFWFDPEEGGLCCENCHPSENVFHLDSAELRWMRYALSKGASKWVNTPEAYAPFSILRDYVEKHMSRKIKSAAFLPDD